MREGWEDAWKPINEKELRGGQGSVIKVVRKSDGAAGALKRLHPQHLESKERRYRMKQEVDALKVLGGQGTPAVLDHNTERWEERGVPLYAVTEWVDGCRLSDFSSGRPISLDQALVVIGRLSEILERCHRVDIIHRDIKPDNIVLADRDPARPVLVDFGMSWSKADEEGDRPFETETGQELGSRFLRLPEHAPGQHERDAASDVTLLVGVLFYLLTGCAPRALADGSGRMPHERALDDFPHELTSDRRWPRLRRVFHVAFQQRMADRYRSAAQLRQALDNLDAPHEEEVDPGRVQLERLSELLESEAARRQRSLQESMRAASRTFLETVTSDIGRANLVAGGSGPNFVGGGWRDEIHFFVMRRENPDPQVRFTHRIFVRQDTVVAEYSVDEGAAEEYYRGLLADSETLKEEAERAGRIVRAAVLERFHEKLARTLKHGG